MAAHKKKKLLVAISGTNTASFTLGCTKMNLYTDRRLSRRIQAHLRGISKSEQSTPVKYRQWAEGKRITIVAYKPPPVELLGRVIPIHRAVEAALIEEIRPKPIDSRPWFVART